MATLHTFNAQVRDTATELVDQEVQKFNEASAGTLVMGNSTVIGDYIENASWKLINGLVQRRNAYGKAAVTPVELSQILDRAVKIDGRVGPLTLTSTLYRRIGSSSEEVASIVASQAAEGMIQDYLNVAAAGLKTAIATQADLLHNVSDATYVPMGLNILNRANSKLGDRSRLIAAYLMHSTVWHEIVGEAIDNKSALYTIGDIGVFDAGLGRRYVVSDIPALQDDELNHTLALTPGAAALQVSGLYDFITTESGGGENITRLMQGEYEFVMGIKGFEWAKKDVKSPTDANLTTAANWKRTATSHKDCAGVLITTGKTPA